jgi:hypothetical protein
MQDDIQHIQQHYGLTPEKALDWFGGPQGSIIVEAGCEGGSCALLGNNGASWRFRTIEEEFALADEETVVPCVSDWVYGWDGALALLDKYPLHWLCPLRVHPDFAPQVWAAVRERFDADEHHRGEWWAVDNLKLRRRLCRGGGRATAYSDE